MNRDGPHYAATIVDSHHPHHYNNRPSRTKTTRWTPEETRRFYMALRQCGTDFTTMELMFPHRDRAQLKVCTWVLTTTCMDVCVGVGMRYGICMCVCGCICRCGHGCVGMWVRGILVDRRPPERSAPSADDDDYKPNNTPVMFLPNQNKFKKEEKEHRDLVYRYLDSQVGSRPLSAGGAC